MLRGEIFPTAKNLIMALLNSKSSISIDNEVELWISCGFEFGLHTVEGRSYRTAWNQFYPVFNTLIKNMTEEAKLFNPPSYVRSSGVLE
jgi:hypothetical protein